jgi:hypothetical protein
MKDLGYCLALIFALGVLLLFVSGPLCEGFESSIRCDVDKPCDGHLKCINGFCAKTDPIGPQPNEVPLLPPGSPAPYF